MALSLFAVSANAGVIGNETSVFMQNCSGRNFATIEDGQTLEQGRFNISSYVSMGQNALPPTRDAFDVPVNAPDSLQNLDSGICYGLRDGLEVGAMVSFLSQQQSGDNLPGGRFARTGLSNILVQAKWTFFDHENQQMAFAMALGQSRIKNDPFVGESNDFAKTFQFIYISSYSWSRLAINVGYRWAAKGAPIAGALYKPVGDRTLASIGLQQDLGYGPWSISEEIFGSVRKESPGMGISQVDLESMVSLRNAWSANLDLQIGGGTGAVLSTSNGGAGASGRVIVWY